MAGERSDWEKFVEFTQNHSALIGIGGTIAGGILSAYSTNRTRQEQAERAAELRETIVSRIQQAETRIIDHMDRLGLEALEGTIRGLTVLFDEFDGTPLEEDEEGEGDNEAEESTLIRIINDCALVQARLEIKMEQWQQRRDNALSAYAIYPIVLTLRIDAMKERKLVYGFDHDDDILNRVRDAQRMLDEMETALKELNDEQCRLELQLTGGLSVTNCICKAEQIGTSTFLEPLGAETACQQFKEENWEVLASTHLEFRNNIDSMEEEYS